MFGRSYSLLLATLFILTSVTPSANATRTPGIVFEREPDVVLISRTRYESESFEQFTQIAIALRQAPERADGIEVFEASIRNIQIDQAFYRASDAHPSRTLVRKKHYDTAKPPATDAERLLHDISSLKIRMVIKPGSRLKRVHSDAFTAFRQHAGEDLMKRFGIDPDTVFQHVSAWALPLSKNLEEAAEMSFQHPSCYAGLPIRGTMKTEPHEKAVLMVKGKGSAEAGSEDSGISATANWTAVWDAQDHALFIHREVISGVQKSTAQQASTFTVNRVIATARLD